MHDIPKIPEHEITPPALYFNRRSLLRAGLAAGSAIATAALYRRLNPATAIDVVRTAPVQLSSLNLTEADLVARGWRVNEPKTSEESIRTYNNFYEFTTDKERVAAAAAKFRTEGWKVVVDGMVHKPRSFTVDDLHAISQPEERVYRMRCVEAWSMVIPWAGIPLSRLLETVEPMSNAKYVAFETLLDPVQMPGQRTSVLEWPYIEGLRLDEAMHPLTILATGLYAKMLPPQDGAPVRLVVPWKYGFKGIKSIVKIRLVADQPTTSWSRSGPTEYGFYANVNPAVDHPRWSQATEQRIGEPGRRNTLLFNGYEHQVAALYAGMDLQANF